MAVSYSELKRNCRKIGMEFASRFGKPYCIVFLLRGGMIPARLLADTLDCKEVIGVRAARLRGFEKLEEPILDYSDIERIKGLGIPGGSTVLIVDDICGSGDTLLKLKNELLRTFRDVRFITAAAIVMQNADNKPDLFGAMADSDWVVFEHELNETKKNMEADGNFAGLQWLAGAFAEPNEPRGGHGGSEKLVVYSSNALGISREGRKYLRKTLLPELKKIDGLEVIDPWNSIISLPESEIPDPLPSISEAERMKIGADNFAMIDRSDLVLANIDGKDVDSGVGAEIGYAYARGKTIIGYYLESKNGAAPMPENIQIESPIIFSGGTVVGGISAVLETLKKIIDRRSGVQPKA